jgi:hypothetical protein
MTLWSPTAGQKVPAGDGKTARQKEQLQLPADALVIFAAERKIAPRAEPADVLHRLAEYREGHSWTSDG